jgi:hypothetical protein
MDMGIGLMIVTMVVCLALLGFGGRVISRLRSRRSENTRDGG